MATDIGRMLRDARHTKGISLSDAARGAGVREIHLDALERDELETIVIDPVYVRGILRTYAGFLDLDVEALVARHRARSAEAPAAGRQPGAVGAAADRGGRSLPRVGAVAGVVLLGAVLAVGTGVVIWAQGRDQPAEVAREPGPSEPARAAVATEVVSDADAEPDAQPDGDAATTGAAAPASDVASDRPSRPAASTDELTVQLEASDEVWVRVLVDGETELEGILQPGEVTTLAGDREIQLRVGRPGAVELSLNGEPYGGLGTDNDTPVDVICTAETRCEVTGVG